MAGSYILARGNVALRALATGVTEGKSCYNILKTIINLPYLDGHKRFDGLYPEQDGCGSSTVSSSSSSENDSLGGDGG